MKEKDREAFVRWQGRALDQMSAVTNLLIALATGVLALVAPTILERTSAFDENARLLSLLSIWSLAISLLTGLILAWNRLQDFRATTQVIRKRGEDLEAADLLREEARTLGKASWRLLLLQTIAFGVGVLAAVFILSKHIQRTPADRRELSVHVSHNSALTVKHRDASCAALPA